MNTNTGAAATIQADLFRPRARTSDPVTSHQAARSMRAAAQAQRDQIMGTLRERPDGLTNDELDQLYGWRAGTASRRTTELLAAGLIARDGTERQTRTGRAALVNRRVA